jgi:hypothetical protein
MRDLPGDMASTPKETSKLMLKALHFAYGVDETYTFEIGPKLDSVKTLISNREGSNA